ncbi:unnamed protein product [Schistocephalus solidus]|uniref:Reverse transcriptase domain-containing protein n=1 Tax=Schistocephalus solidus TaxID=70667 RepID=A0A183SYK0_SCHSO|nr:unnamed protein product [Schistocephalus solidus]
MINELLESRYNETDEMVKRRHLIQLLKFCPKTNFTFEGTTYEQVKGKPIGPPLSGFIAEAVLPNVETLVFANYKPKFWTRYVDDTFVIIERETVKELHDSLNSIFPDIHFTMEVEENNQLPFLDVLVHRKPSGDLKATIGPDEPGDGLAGVKSVNDLVFLDLFLFDFSSTHDPWLNTLGILGQTIN